MDTQTYTYIGKRRNYKRKERCEKDENIREVRDKGIPLKTCTKSLHYTRGCLWVPGFLSLHTNDVLDQTLLCCDRITVCLAGYMAASDLFPLEY